MPPHRSLPVPWRKVPLPRVHFNRDAKVRPPGIRPGDQLVAPVEPRIEQRHRETSPLDQAKQYGLWPGPGTLNYFRERGPEQRRSMYGPALQLGLQLLDGALSALHGGGDHGARVPDVMQASRRTGHRPGRQRVLDRTGVAPTGRQSPGQVDDDERGALLPTVRRTCPRHQRAWYPGAWTS